MKLVENFENYKTIVRDESLEVRDKRRLLVKLVKGMGMKEASHFLRNVYVGRNLAILDRHILKSLVELKIIEEIPKNLTIKRYEEIEEKMSNFAEKNGFSMFELDFVLWWKVTGRIFK